MSEPYKRPARQADGFPPRGVGQAGLAEALPNAVWGHPWQLGPASWHWRPGMLLLGEWQGRRLGFGDNRHVVTIAGSRAGKSTTVLMPNLLVWPGSALVLDPKGELARATALARRRMGQEVFVLDPFGASGAPSNAHNPFDELSIGRAHVEADAAQLAEALIIGNDKDPHWTDSARNLIRGITLHLMSGGGPATLRELRRLLNADEGELSALFRAMSDSKAFDGALSNVGAAFLGKLGGGEFQSILSTAQEQTTSLDDVRKITDRSDFQLRALKDRKVTIYLVLPGMRMGTHARWLRLVIQQALAAMEMVNKPDLDHPVLFMLEEFAILGHMRSIETAAGFMAGFGVKLWSVLQDITQLKTHYKESWETFLGNAGIIQAFGNGDLTTTEYLSKRLGHTTVVEKQDVHVSGSAMAHGDLGRREHVRHTALMEAAEITMFFSRESNRQLVLVPGRPPVYMNRLKRSDP
jgi:type IV secretion system protein VirD4